MSRKGNRIGNGATEQVFGHLKDEFFRDRKWPDFESFKADLNAYVTYWNTQRRQVKLKGPTPEEFRNQSLAALFLFRPSKFWGAVHVRSALVVSRGKTYRYQRFLCTTGLQICQAELRYILVCPARHRLCVRAPTPRFCAAAPTCDGIYHRASHAALPDFPAPPHNRLQAPQSCRHCQPCACDVR